MTAPLSPRPESTLRRLWAGWRREIIRGTGLFILVVGGGILIVGGVRHGTARVRERFRGLAEQLPGDLDIGSSDGPRQTGDTMRWSGAAPAGNTVFIRNTNGGITVDGSQGREVRVTGVKSWGQSDPSEVRRSEERRVGKECRSRGSPYR